MGKRPGGLAGEAGMGKQAGIWRALSYMLNRTWITTAFFSVALFQHYAPEAMAAVANDVYRSSILALGVGLTAFALLHRQVMAWGQHAAFDYAGPALAGAGILLLVPSLVGGRAISDPVLWGSAALTGVGSALVLLALGRRFVGVDVRSCTIGVLWATVGCALLTLAIMALPFAAAVVAEVTLPFACIASLHQVPLPGTGDSQPRTSFGERISAKMLFKLATCAAVLGIMTGITRDLYFTSGASALDQAFQTLNSLVPLATALALLAGMAITRDVSIEALYKPTALVCVVGFAVMPLTGADITVPYAIVTAGYTLFEILVWVILSEVASRFQFTSVQVFGYGRALVLFVGVIAGASIASALAQLGVGPHLFSTVAAVAIISISFLRTYVFTSSDLALFEKNLAGQEADAPEGGAREGEGEARGRVSAVAWFYNAGQHKDEAREHATATAEGRVREGTGAAGTERARARVSPAGQEHAGRPQKVPFQRKCAIIGDYYGLTRREVDVFRLIAAGRNCTRIQEELSISAGTVNTHSHHIFQKLDVHSQQEVIDLFQHADLDAMQEEIASRKAAGAAG